MLEKDIENLLAKYPAEFLPKHNLTAKGQQVRIGSYYADILFQDSQGNLVIVEIKRGLLRREALGQAIEYYGLLRKKEPNKEIRLMLVANVIPDGMTAFLNEKLGVEFLQIPQSKINFVAEKYGYKFLDSEQPKVIQEYRQAIDKMDFVVDSSQPAVWIFQANPERYDVLNALADETLTDDMWLVSRYQNYIHSGDSGLIWMSGKEGGIFAVVEVTSNPQMMYDSEQSTKYWLNETDQRQMMLRVKIRYKLKLVNNPILKEELRNEPDLCNMEIFRRPIGTNFRVTNGEWQAILRLIKQRFVFETYTRDGQFNTAYSPDPFVNNSAKPAVNSKIGQIYEQDTPEKGWKHLIKEANSEVQAIAKDLAGKITELPKVTSRPSGKNYIFDKCQSGSFVRFVAFMPRRQALAIRIRTDTANYPDAQGLIGEKTYNWFFHNGNGVEREFRISDMAQVDYAFGLIKRSYELAELK